MKGIVLNIDISEYNLPAKGRLSIALLSDIHDRPLYNVIKLLRKRRPDIIVIAGDLTDGRILFYLKRNGLANRRGAITDNSENTMYLIRNLVEIAPTYYSLGNHERILTPQDIKQIRKTGVKVLDNKFCRINRDFLIGGLTSAAVLGTRAYRKRHKDWLWIDKMSLPQPELDEYKTIGSVPEYKWLDDFEKKKGYKILLCHHPEYWAIQEPMLCNRKIDLVCSGHGHGGQIRIMGQGLFAPGQGLLPKYAGGLCSKGSRSLVVSRGLANTAPIPRIGNPCELVWINLYQDDCN